jgi:hypothetical protein
MGQLKKGLISVIKKITDSGTLEPCQKPAVVKAVKALHRAVASNDRRKLEKAVNRLAHIFVSVVD